LFLASTAGHDGAPLICNAMAVAEPTVTEEDLALLGV
jgi:hypothetical protein